MTIIDIADLDCIYLSYDEPRKEETWIKIQNMVPWAKRVDGVKGSDAAKSFMAELRAKRKGNKGGGGSAAPPASDIPPAPKQEDIIIEPPPVEPKRRSRKKITVDFNNV